MRREKWSSEVKTAKSTRTSFEVAQEIDNAMSSSRLPQLLHVGRQWFMWSGKEYRPTWRESVSQLVLRFMAENGLAVSVSAIRNVVSLLQMIRHRDVGLTPCWIEKNGTPADEYFAVQNGLLHLDEGEAILTGHDANLFGLTSAGYEFNPKASCPNWIEFLNELWGSDQWSIDTLQEWFGYCVLSNTSHQKIFAVVGVPRSGKSTIGRVLRQLIASGNVSAPSIRDLCGNFGLWALVDKKLAIIPDATLDRSRPSLEELLKSVSGEDAVDIHRKLLPPITGVKLKTRIMLLANALPDFSDALTRRLIVVRTHKSFSGKEDTLLTQRLQSELPGILNWSLDGIRRLNQRGRFCPEGHPLISMPSEASSVLVKKLQKGKEDMAIRCAEIGKRILDEAGVKTVHYEDGGLSGRSIFGERTVWVPKPTTRRRLYILAHEAGHIAMGHNGKLPAHREEFEADKYAHRVMRENGVPVPKRSTQAAKKHVAREIRQAVARGATDIDYQAFRWCRDRFQKKERIAIQVLT